MNLIPIREREKIPLVSWMVYQGRYSSSEEVTRWKVQFPNCNWACVTGKVSGLVVLDCDSKEAYELAQQKGLPKAPIVKTSRGYHVYFRYKDGTRSLQSVAGRTDIQLKAEAGYVLIPPSIHPSGVSYEWAEGLSIEEIDPPELPDWVLCYQGTELTVKELYKGVSEGSRNNALARLAGSWVHDGLSFEDCLENARIWNHKNTPPLMEDELATTIKSILDGHQRRHPDLFPQDETTPLESLPDFLKRDIPPVEFYIPDFIVKEGRTLISAPTNVGKSLFCANLCLALSTGGDFLGRKVTLAKVLYLNCEMNECIVRERFAKMVGESVDKFKNVFVRTMMPLDLLNEKTQDFLGRLIKDNQINVLIIDTIGSAWSGNENDKQEVTILLNFIKQLIAQHKISIVLVHHWKKSTPNQVRGGEMAAGSYKWTGDMDNHITLEGNDIGRVVVSSAKARAGIKFKPFVMAFNADNFLAEYIGDSSKKFGPETLDQLMKDGAKVSIPELIKRAKGIVGESTLRKLIKQSDKYAVDTVGKVHYLYERVISEIQTPPVDLTNDSDKLGVL